MYATALDALVTSQPAARLGGVFGYRMEGDEASLNAELAVIDAAQLGNADWALQLWACDADANGRLQGIKVAEVPLGALQADPYGTTPVAGNAVALPPAGTGTHTIVLALASGISGQYGQIHDFAVFGNAQQFTQPRLDGAVGYQFGDNTVRLSVERIANPREAGSVSGTLALELWALDAPYSGGAFAGSLVGGVQIGSLEGQSEWRDVAVNADTAALAAGTWNLVLMLREWTPAGFVTRDYSNFANPHVVVPAQSVEVAVEVAAVEAPVAEQQAEPAAAPAKAAAEKPAVAAAPKAAAAPAAVEAKPAAAEKPAVEAKPAAAAKTSKAAKPATEAKAAPAKTASVTSIDKASKAKALPSVNESSAEELASVKGLSKTAAKAIIAARPYKSLDELTRAKGVGEKLLAKIRQQVSL